MNRGTVILLALAILLAHTFAIHQTPNGEFADPYEIAHVAFRLGRNLVYQGAAIWNPGGAPTESYPSPLWVLVSAAAARTYCSPIVFAQSLGLFSALATIVVLAQFSPKRISGLIAPVLLAASGSVAAAAVSGTEASLAMLLVTAAFLAFERGWGRILALSLSLLILTRPEGCAVMLWLLASEKGWRPRGAHGPRAPRLGAFWIPILLALAVTGVRRVYTGFWLSPLMASLFRSDPEGWRVGGEYLLSFATCSGFALLFLVIILSVVAGRCSAMGGRALATAGLWWGLVAFGGGDGLPFWNALVPTLPLFFLGAQECVREWMDEREGLARLAWPLLLVSLTASLLVSKTPGDLGPLRLEEPLTAWQTPRGALAKAYPRHMGRLGLLEELRAVEHLRTLGVFLRDRVGADATILTSWPGAIGYISRKEILDLSGRAWPPPGHDRPLSWRGVSRLDLVSSLNRDVDYIVPLIGTVSGREAPTDFLTRWLEHNDIVGPTESRVREVLRALNGYMLVSVPVPAESRTPDRPSEYPFQILQRKELGLIPTLALEVSEDSMRVFVRHEGHQQVVDLCVRAVTIEGDELYLTPTGGWVSATPRDARTSLLVFPTGTRAIQLVEARIPDGMRGGSITAWVHNPGMRPEAPLSQVGAPVSQEL